MATTINSLKIEYSWNNFKVQILSAVVIGISMIHAGLTIAFPNLLEGSFTEQEISSFASVSALATPLGSCVVSCLVDKLGRKYNLIIIQVFCALTWISASVINNVVSLYFCAITAGLSRGALTASSAAYISEITHSHYRQLFLSLTTTFFTLGIFIITALNVLMTFRYAGLCLTISFVLIIILTAFIVPESPHWLAVIKLDLDKAKRQLERLNPDKTMFDKEWRSIEGKLRKSDSIISIKQKILLLKKHSTYKPCLVLMGLIFFQQFCGIYPFTSYTLWSLPKFGDFGEKYKSQVFLASGIIRLIVGIATAVALMKYNQKQLILVSSLGMLFSSTVIIFNREVVVRFISNSELPVTEWISVISFLFYILAGYIGLLGIPWTVIFELLPTEVKGILGPFLVAFGYVTMSFVLKIFPHIYDLVGMTNIFIYIILITFCATLYVHHLLIETKGKSLYEIENFYSKKNQENKHNEESDSA